MTEAFPEPILPLVDDTDLIQILFEDITEPDHQARWQYFAEHNPVLAREIARHVYEITEDQIELAKLMLDEITFVYSALEAAAKRRHASASGDDDGVNQQP